jgi:hypothetical protein
MNRLIRSILFGGTAAIALAAGTAHARDVEHARPPKAPIAAPARPHVAPGPRDRDHQAMQRDYRDLAAARDRVYRGWHGDRHDRYRFERWYAARRFDLARRWAHLHGRG